MKSNRTRSDVENLPAFEQLVLLALLSLKDETAYGMNIRAALREHAGRDVSVPTVYSALDRLESKGLISSSLGEPTAERGGRAKRVFQVEPAGVRALESVRNTLQTLWRLGGLDQ